MHYISLLAQSIPMHTQSEKIKEILKDSATSWIGLIVILLVMIFIIQKLRARFRDSEGTDANAHLMLTQIGELHRKGELTEEEFRSIKNRLIPEIEKKSTNSFSSSSPDEEATPEQPGTD